MLDSPYYAEAAQILVVVNSVQAADIVHVSEDFEKRLSDLLSRGSHLEVWYLLPSDSMLAHIRGLNCKIYERQDGRPVQLAKRYRDVAMR